MWSKSHDVDILKKLGIIDGRGEAESEEEMRAMVTASEGDDDDESHVVFDRTALLTASRASPVSRAMSAASFCRAFVVCVAFFAMGLCLSICGPTLPDLQLQTNSSSLSSVMAVVSSNGFGIVLGIAFAGGCFTCVNAFCVMGVCVAGAGVATLLIPTCMSITTLILCSLFQGVALGFIQRGGVFMFLTYWNRRYHVLQLFFVALALGACVAPLITTPFVYDRLQAYVVQKGVSNDSVVPASHLFPIQKREAIQELNGTQLLNNTEVPKKPKFQEEGFGLENKEEAADLIKILTTKTTPTPTPSSTTSTTPESPSTKSYKRLFPEKDSEEEIASINTTTKPEARNQSSWEKTDLWGFVLRRVAEMNRVAVAYSLVALVCGCCSLCFALLCCCVPCSSLRLPTPAAGVTSPTSFCSNPEIVKTMLLGLLLGAVVVGAQWTAGDLLPIFVLQTWTSGTQAEGVLLVSVFWLGVFLSRFLALSISRLLSPAVLLSVCLVSSLLLSGLLSVSASDSWLCLWLGAGGLGLSLGCIFPVLLVWLDQQLSPPGPAWTLLLEAAQLGRLLMSPVTAAVMEKRDSPTVLHLSLLVALVSACVVWMFLRRTGKIANQLMTVAAFSRQIKQANGEVVEYRRMSNNEDTGLEMDNLDEILLDDAETVHYHRGDVLEPNEGIFSQYLSKNRSL